MERKRILLIAGFALVTIILGYFLYRVFFAAPKPPSPPAPPPPPPPAGQFPEAGIGVPGRATPTPGGLPTVGIAPERPGAPRGEIVRVEPVQQVVADTIKNPSIDKNGGVQFYNIANGQFYRLNAQGQIELLSDQVFFNVDKVTWSPNQNESIIEYPDGANIYYNFATKRQATLPRHWQEFSFAPEGQQIAAKSIGFSPENRWLVAADPDGKNATLVEPLGDNASRVTVDWSPNQQIVALSRTGEPLGADREEVLFIGLHGENFKSTVVEGRDLRSQWSPTGERLLYSVYSGRNDFKPELWIVGAQGDQIGTDRTPLGVSTWADKCTFQDNRYVYCGVPSELPTGAGFAPEIANAVPDRLVRIDTQTGIQTEIPVNTQPTVDSLFLSDKGDAIYFTDKQKAGLFRVDL